MDFPGKKSREARQEQDAVNRQSVLDALNVFGSFMSAVEIMEASGLSPATTIKTLDSLYWSNRILKKFSTPNGKAIILAVDESLVPELGYSGKLDGLMAGAGIDVSELKEVQVTYKSVRDDNGGPFVPDLIPGSDDQPIFQDG